MIGGRFRGIGIMGVRLTAETRSFAELLRASLRLCG